MTEQLKPCRFCISQWDAEHEMICKGHEHAPISAEIYFTDGYNEPVLSLNAFPLEEQGVEVMGTSVDIKYCPMCGRKLV